MTPTLTRSLAAAALTCVVATLPLSTAARAADIRALLPAELIAQHCQSKGVGSNDDGIFRLPDGQRLTGSVLCTAADMLTQPGVSLRTADDDEHDNEAEDESEDDDA